ncbi:MAG: HAMP domain-containing histidine kinase, partial [Proteobacteria bacterium]|nr:HAMP domain-containing histidine kinase [Pseudomonadota bacterium]
DQNLQIRIATSNVNATEIYNSGIPTSCDTSFWVLREFITLCGHDENSALTVDVTREVRSLFGFWAYNNIPFLFLTFIAFIVTMLIVIRRLLNKEVILPMNYLVESLGENQPYNQMEKQRAYEWNLLSKAIDEYKTNIIKYIENQNQMSKDLEREKLISEITAQLAHDIRSPLAALDVMAGSMEELDHNKRTLVRNATARIHNIANNLLDRSLHQNNVSTQMFSSIIRSMLFEKREQYKSNSKISIHEHVSHNSYGAFAKIEINDFKRMLSNLIDNAVEAIPSTGFVRVALSQNDDFVVIEIFDNGKGIPTEELHKVTEKGYTKRKEGSGLGLYFVYQKLKEWGGRLEIESNLDGGTSVKMIIRKEPPPAWFVSEITINDDDEYVVLDDDFSIHEMWKNKVLQAVRRNIKMKHFENEQSFREWFVTHRDQNKKTTYFFDYELLGNVNSGLDIIEKYKINSDAILITSHYENEEIQKRCERIGVKMIPKEMAGLVPVIAQA